MVWNEYFLIYGSNC